MSKRIFTRVYEGTVGATGTALVEEPAKESWLLQEDIEVIGAEIALINQAPSENDGFAVVFAELSQTAIRGQDGAILVGQAYEGWNTTPAGVDVIAAHPIVSFPQGFAVPVKEEGYLYVNTAYIGKSAGVSIFHYEVVVYYTKKGSR